MPDSFTIHKAKTTDQIIFISFYSNINADQFTTQLSTRLLHTERFTITRKTRNEYWIKDAGSKNFLKTAEITKLDEGIIFRWNKILCYFSSFTQRHTVIYNTFQLLLCLLHSQVPLTTTNFILVQIFSQGSIRNTMGVAICFEHISVNLNAKVVTQIIKVMGEVNSAWHVFVLTEGILSRIGVVWTIWWTVHQLSKKCLAPCFCLSQCLWFETTFGIFTRIVLPVRC